MTQLFLKEVKKLKEDAKETLGDGRTLNDRSIENTAIMTAKKVGICDAIDDVIEIPDYSEEE